MSHASLELFDVALKGSCSCALYIPTPSSETTLVAKRCEFANSRDGVIIHGLSFNAFTNIQFGNKLNCLVPV